jgi:hypothetical protein
MGGCDTASIGARGFGLSTDFLCYWRFPGAGEEALVPSGVLGPALGPEGGGYGTAPIGYFLFLLVPLVATVLGGRWAAQRTAAEDRSRALTTAALSGVAFALLVGGAILLSRIVVSVSGAAGGFRQGGGVTLGPNLLTGTGLALLWGVAGGAVGALLGTRRGRARSNEPDRGPGPSDEDHFVRP